MGFASRMDFLSDNKFGLLVAAGVAGIAYHFKSHAERTDAELAATKEALAKAVAAEKYYSAKYGKYAHADVLAAAHGEVLQVHEGHGFGATRQADDTVWEELSHIQLSEEDQKKVDEIKAGKLKYLNESSHANDRAVITSIYEQYETEKGSDKLNVEAFKKKFPKSSASLLSGFDLDHDGNVTKAEFMSFVDNLSVRARLKVRSSSPSSNSMSCSK